ncbi:MAG: ABC transporter ATP-binding protein [Proteobacteria bacterium]|nr:ABC transporter ATP-binding protein [Pseudomonadota bacterium]
MRNELFKLVFGLHNAGYQSLLLEIKNLRKYFGELKAVDGVSFAVPKGVCLGLLGPNGAGKTTTIEMIEGLIAPTSGEIFFKGKPITNAFKRSAGIQLQHTALQDFISVKENLILFKALYDSSINIEELVALCGLQEFINRDTRKISGGQRQRLLLALALINQPELLILDEPTVGLDPQARHNFWKLIDKIKKQATTIILTTHYMEEASTLCDELVIIDHGKVIAKGTPSGLIAQRFSNYQIRLPKNGTLKLPDTIAHQESGDYFVIDTQKVDTCIRELLQAGVSLEGITIFEHNLEDLFLHLTGHQLRE